MGRFSKNLNFFGFLKIFQDFCRWFGPNVFLLDKADFSASANILKFIKKFYFEKVMIF